MIALPIFLFFAIAFISLFIRSVSILSLILAAGTAFFLFYTMSLDVTALKEAPLTYNFGNFSPAMGIQYQLDHISAYMLFVLAFISFFSVPQCISSLSSSENDIPPNKRHYIVFLYSIMVAALCGIILTHDIFNFYIFLELASITAYIFVALNRHSTSKFAALYYLLIGGIASGLILMGISILYGATASLNMKIINQVMHAHQGAAGASAATSPYVVAFCFVIMGFVVKIGLFPFFRWVPLVYESLPPAIAPFYTSIFSKVVLTGLISFLYRVFGFDFFLHQPTAYKALCAMFSIGIIVFSIKAIYEEDSRKVFAYSGMTQISYIMLSLFLFVPSAMSGAIIHLFHDAIIKCGVMMMFWLNSGANSDYSIQSLAGFHKKSPILAACFVIFSLSLVGMPGTSGFISKLYMLTGALEAHRYDAFAVLVSGSLLSIIYFWKMLSIMFFPKQKVSTKARSTLQLLDKDTDEQGNTALRPGGATVGIFLVQVTIVFLAVLSLVLGVYTKLSLGVSSSLIGQ